MQNQSVKLEIKSLHFQNMYVAVVSIFTVAANTHAYF